MTIALVATPEAPVTSVALQSGTWFTDVPRIWRTPSRIEVEAVHVRFGEPAARGQHRQRAAELDAAALGERPALAALAEAVVLEAA